MDERVSSLETNIRDPNSVLNVNCLLVSVERNPLYSRTRLFPLRKY